MSNKLLILESQFQLAEMRLRVLTAIKEHREKNKNQLIYAPDYLQSRFIERIAEQKAYIEALRMDIAMLKAQKRSEVEMEMYVGGAV